jgi:putative hydrolase of the HAD superfamily
LLIAFDLDDTLIDTSGVVTPLKLREVLHLLSSHGVPIGPFEEAFQEMQTLDKSCVTSKDTVRLTLERYGAVNLYQEALSLYTKPLPKDFQIPTTPHAKKVIDILKKRSHTIALVTGGKRTYQLEKLKKAGLEPAMFSKISVPEDSQKKPYYEALQKEFSASSGDCVAVGDRIPMDLAPAHELGWRTVHMRWGRGHLWKKEHWIDHSIRELSELLEIL